MNTQKILVVDDDKRLLDSIKDILNSCQYQPTVADDGEKALNLLGTKEFDIVITDNKMPKISGTQLLNHIKIKYPGIKVIMMTGYPEEKTFFDSLDLGAFDCLVKPFRVSELLSAIVNCQQVKELPVEDRQLSNIIFCDQKDIVQPDTALEHFLGVIAKLPFENQIPMGAAIFSIVNQSDISILHHFGLDSNIAGEICEEISSSNPKSNPGWYEFFYLSRLVAKIGKDFQSSLCAPLIQNEENQTYLALFFNSRFIKQSYYYNKVLGIFAESFVDLLKREDTPIPRTEHQLNIITTLVRALDEKNRFVSGHSENVKQYSLQIATHMGMSEEKVKKIGMAGLLHDIGKIAISNSILMKKGKLNANETGKMKEHPIYGSKWLNHIQEFQDILPLLLYHHEWFDGNGYPHGLKANEIPLGARILSISDTFDAITSDRAYRTRRKPTVAYKELLTFADSQFDPEIVDVFMDWVQSSDPFTLMQTDKTPESKQVVASA